ncbi:MAG TPA: DUF86 domain-containing protein [Bacillales bacterium]|nr:DUF86 domain-containing protein [Bacillales bacterium]
MYFVDRQQIETLLIYMEKELAFFKQHDSWNEEVDKLALERLVHVLIESVIDVGNQIIDGFIMRDPGSYADIIDILNDEAVISNEEAASLASLIEVRKELVRSYSTVDHDRLLKVVTDQLPALKDFPAAVRRYLNEELGPVSAFSNENKQEN